MRLNFITINQQTCKGLKQIHELELLDRINGRIGARLITRRVILAGLQSGKFLQHTYNINNHIHRIYILMLDAPRCCDVSRLAGAIDNDRLTALS